MSHSYKCHSLLTIFTKLQKIVLSAKIAKLETTKWLFATFDDVYRAGEGAERNGD